MAPPFEAAQITVIYTLVYSVTLFIQVYMKKKLYKKAKQQGKQYDRYTLPQMLSYDRLNANFREWTLPFLGPLWSLALTEKLTIRSIWAAWIYVGLRTLYIGLVCQYGVSKIGYNSPLWISTLPAYLCLLYLVVVGVLGVF